MKKIVTGIFLLSMLFLTASCRETTQQKVEDATEAVGEDIGNAVEATGETIEEGVEDFDNELEEERAEDEREEIQP